MNSELEEVSLMLLGNQLLNLGTATLKILPLIEDSLYLSTVSKPESVDLNMQDVAGLVYKRERGHGGFYTE